MKPGLYGWNVRAGGRVAVVEPAPEWRATTVQACGLWPFAAGSGIPTEGVPLGRHVSGATLCADPINWFVTKLIFTPSAFVLGRPGLGKSSLIRRMITGLADQGVWPMVLGDLKPDYTRLIRILDGHVVVVTRQTVFNPLDLIGAHGRLCDLPESIQRVAAADLIATQGTVIESLIVLSRSGGSMNETEKSVLRKALNLLQVDEFRMPLKRDTPVLGDLYRKISGTGRVGAPDCERDPDLMAQALVTSVEEYDAETRKLRSSLKSLLSGGPFGDIFDGPTTEHLELGRPGSFDISDFDGSDQVLEAAIQLACWAYGSATLQLSEKLADAGLQPRIRYLLVLDELWRILRAGGGQLVMRVDALTRTNRERGVGQVMITHTMHDLTMSSPKDTEMARGFVERSSMVFLGGLADQEMGNLREVFAISEREHSMITDWSIEGSHDPESGKGTIPPGRGRFLLKTGKAPGKPFVVVLTEPELAVNDTNRRWEELAIDPIRDSLSARIGGGGW